MTRRLESVPDARPEPRRLNSRREIDEWATERYATLSALVAAERPHEDPPAQLELGEAA